MLYSIQSISIVHYLYTICAKVKGRELGVLSVFYLVHADDVF